MAVPEDVPIQAGRAGLLCHKHDDLLWNQRSFLVRGTIERCQGGWSFQPVEFVPGIGVGGPLGMVRFMLKSRRDTKRYLAKRGLARPSIPWHDINRKKNLAAHQQAR